MSPSLPTPLRPSGPTRRRLLQGSAVMALAAGADLTLTPAEQALARGAVDLDILYIGAHPDDEAWTLAAFGQWNEFQHQSAGVITVTRGEGGGNAVGLAEGPELGIIREAEERVAVGLAGIEHVFNLDAVDFFYTLSAPLTRDVWGEKSVLRRIIRVIRATRPEVIVTMNPSAVEGNHGNHQQAAVFAVEAYLLAGRKDVFPEHFDEGLRPFSPSRLLRSGSDGTGETGPDAVAHGFTPTNPTDLVFGAWNGTASKRHDMRWSAVADQSVQAYATQGWRANPPSPTEPEKIPATWFTLIDSRTPLPDPTSGDDAALRGASLPLGGGLPRGTRLEITSDRFAVVPSVPFTVEVTVGSPGSALPKARLDLDLPRGWHAEGNAAIGTVPAKQSRTARFTVTPGADAKPGTGVRLPVRLRTNKGHGENSLPLEVTGPVTAGIADRPEIAEFLEWTAEHGMQRLDALVPTRRALGSGMSAEFSIEARNSADEARPVDITIAAPDGITVTPTMLHLDAVPASGTDTATVTIHNTDASLPTANRAENGGVYPLEVRATSGGVTAVRKQGLHLLPRLVAEPTQGVDVDAVRGTSEYPGEAIDVGTLWEGAKVSPADASGSTWVTYDQDALHVFVQVTDDTFGTVLGADDNKQRFRTDSIEIMIDPRGTSQNTASTFILGVLPDTLAPDGASAGVAAGRDHDQHQGAIESTAPTVQVAAHVNDPYDGYTIETRIPFDELPDAVDPEHLGFNVVVYDSDTQDRTGQSRIGWSTFPGVQADPYRWGVLQLPDLEKGQSSPEDPVIPDSAARSVQSPQSILQSAADGVGLGGSPALPAGTLRLDHASLRHGSLRVRVRSDVAGTLRLYAWDGSTVLGHQKETAVGRGTRTVTIALSEKPGAGARVRVAASLETTKGSAAASVRVG